MNVRAFLSAFIIMTFIIAGLLALVAWNEPSLRNSVYSDFAIGALLAGLLAVKWYEVTRK